MPYCVAARWTLRFVFDVNDVQPEQLDYGVGQEVAAGLGDWERYPSQLGQLRVHWRMQRQCLQLALFRRGVSFRLSLRFRKACCGHQ
jgi:hypothetical protein